MKTAMILIVLYYISLIVDAAVHRTTIKKTVSIRQQLLRAGKLKEYNRLARTLLREKGRIGILDYMDNIYVIDVGIGSPPQQFELIPDTGSSDLWVISMDCKSNPCLRESVTHGKNQFDPRKSSTNSAYGQNFSLHYASGHVSGELMTDQISLGNFTIANQVFGAANEIGIDLDNLPVDGVIGFAWPALSSFKVTPPLQAILNDLNFQIMTIYMYGNVEPWMEKVQGGELILGDFNFDYCYPNINWVQLTSQTFWQFTIKGVKIGAYESTTWQQAISDTGTSYLQIPSYMMKSVIEEINATYSFNDELYLINCAMKVLGPDIKINIGGNYYSIPPKQYIRTYMDYFRQEICVFGAFENFSIGFSPSWILGDVFIRSFCHIYDFENDRIGFASIY